MHGPAFLVYIAVSADGFIATPDGGVGWLDEFGGDDHYGYATFAAGVDTVVMGRASYEKVLGFGGDWPYPGKRSIVLTSRPLPPDPPAGIERRGGPDGVAGLVAELRGRPDGGDVWIVGGARTIRGFLDAGAVDRLDIFVMPVLLGDGLPLFERSGRGARRLDLRECRSYPDGVAHISYSTTAGGPDR